MSAKSSSPHFPAPFLRTHRAGEVHARHTLFPLQTSGRRRKQNSTTLNASRTGTRENLLAKTPKETKLHEGSAYFDASPGIQFLRLSPQCAPDADPATILRLPRAGNLFVLPFKGKTGLLYPINGIGTRGILRLGGCHAIITAPEGGASVCTKLNLPAVGPHLPSSRAGRAGTSQCARRTSPPPTQGR